MAFIQPKVWFHVLVLISQAILFSKKFLGADPCDALPIHGTDSE